MPVPIPRQRTLPAAESGQAHAAPMNGGPADGAPEAGTTAAPRPAEDTADSATVRTETETNTDTGTDTENHTEKARTRITPDSAGATTTAPTHLTLLLIEDDPAGSPIVPALLDRSGRPIRVRTARNLTEAERLLTDDVHCILLDLALSAPGGRPAHGGGNGDGNTGGEDAHDELAVLKHVLELAPRHAVLALTASGDAERGAEAVRVGAQDYLFRDELDGRLLSRAIRYAVERKRSDSAERRLAEGRLHARENRRLERGLLPTPLLAGSPLHFAARYRPGRSRALLGGDFYDVVRTPDGTVHAMIGDVCGHGPDEAALGVELRIAWRALTLAGLYGDELLGTLQQVLEHERADDEIFATLCAVDISPDGREAGLWLAGHPSPLLARPGHPARLLPYDDNGPALGLLSGAHWPRTQVGLGAEWSLMLYTDGLIEGRVGDTGERLGQDGMVGMVSRRLTDGLRGEELLQAAVDEARDLNGGELTDDVAVLLLDRVPQLQPQPQP
ncbi:PP2C family protein-serine/threonine phosphatase [Streptomyces sp. NEAU-W12]|uniref:PP2C family protein-serine/threonine phosphatase n=1 Tax=Streptomyces sp. NEAU-W12 TaxID=2994668 RepID=UPI00224A8097|nr:fused response regulator/phosphatase [Streptomyces sp. NEAU-W12]MCX2927560.1 fused response regulator/phosphatase [Streptomyces sp. NEAU-W12]